MTKNKLNLLAVLINIILINCSVYADSPANPEELAGQAISSNQKEAEIAVEKLRELGTNGLDILFESYTFEIASFKQTGAIDEKWLRIAKALDGVAMQKDAYAARLFWHTNLLQAKSEAYKQNKPILSLRLLGNLNEELSCANSRFFRAILYPNSQISKYLRENFILHWQSERPAPKITIDFGDGRRIERTITGNSIHYILDGEGRIIEALSGLNTPQIFLEFLKTGQNLAHGNSNLNIYRGSKHRELTMRMNRLGKQLKLQFDTSRQPLRNYEEMPAAISAMSVAITKRMVEMPDLRSITPDITRFGEEQIDLESWKKLANLSGITANLDENSIAFIRRQTAGNQLTEKEFTGLIAKLEEYVSIDSVRNEFLLRPALLVYLAKGEGNDLEKFNAKVYSRLFLTPKADKWLGLYAPDIYSGLDGNGVKY